MKPGQRSWRRLFVGAWRTVDANVDAELGFHFQERVAVLRALGLPEGDARAQALAEFGDMNRVRADLKAIDDRMRRQQRRTQWWERITQDMGYALRGLRRSPGFTATVVVTLALGIGANAAIFSVLDRMLIRTPPGVTDASHVHRVWQQYIRPAQSFGPGQSASAGIDVRPVFAYPEIRDLASAVPKSVTLAGYRTENAHLGVGADAPEVVVTYVVGDYFGVLGLHPAVGRFFSPDEYRVEGLTALAVIGYRMWIDRFGGNASVLGQTLDIGSHRLTIIGVAPADFRGTDLDGGEVWAPLSAGGTWKGRNPAWYEGKNSLSIRLLARAPSRADANALERAATIALRRTGVVRDSLATATLASLGEALDPGFGRTQLLVAKRLGVAAAIILLIACANVANLLLARAMRRRREIAVRLALGISRRRLVAQLLTESVAIAFISSAVALTVAIWGATALRRGLLPDVRWGEPAINLRVAAFAVAVALFAGLAAGLAPALQASAPSLINSLKGNEREGAVQRSKLRSALLVAQTALSVVLLAGGALFVQSLRAVESVNIGYDVDGLLFAQVGYDRELEDHGVEIANRLPDVADRLAREPGVQRVALALNVPMRAFSFTSIFLPGRDSTPSLGGAGPIVAYVSPEFLPTVGIRLRAGRGFTGEDRAGSELVIVVNATMAGVFWPGESAIGKCLITGKRDAPCRTVIGIVEDSHYSSIVERPSMLFYIPLSQAAPGNDHPGALAVRTAPGKGDEMAARLRRALVDGFGSWAVPRVYQMSEILAPQLRPWRLSAALFSVTGLLALLVAAVGIYSTVAYMMSQRVHEMGVRVALGAQGVDVIRLVLFEGVRVVVVGVVVGTAIALAAGRFVASLLYGVTPHDPAVLTAVALTLVAVAIVACLVPARRAMRVDPVEALRAE